ncbi:MAG TPA: F0F1 ATP synthase subunit A [Methanothrix soehngenii]|nr:F0F1 ATP synthase subunit A [Methanothrix soehngenii]
MVQINPDEIVYWKMGAFMLNETIVSTWLVMALLVLFAWLSTRQLSLKPPLSKRQALLETIISYMKREIEEIARRRSERYIPFLGTLFLFISVSSLLAVVPGFRSPASSLSTTLALALCVFFAVPIFGIVEQGAANYFRRYIQPSVLMLPFNIIGEFSRTMAMALRLFGNMMSQNLLVAVLLSIVPLFLPAVLDLFGLLIGQVQAYIFAVLATVYIISGGSVDDSNEEKSSPRGV